MTDMLEEHRTSEFEYAENEIFYETKQNISN